MHCSRCGADKQVKFFQKDKASKTGIRSECKDCSKKQKRACRYGLPDGEYQRMHDHQNGVCLLCPSTEKLYIYHNHSTGKVRGLLCHKCNSGLGLLGDSPARLRTAAKYLELNGYYGTN